MKHKKWTASELQNLLAMILSGFKIPDLCLAFKCTQKQIYTACKYYFGMPVMFIRYRYKVEVMK